ncbi:hypothetical protein VTO73DRAFT_9476 [Trametes versicolor]
MDISPPSWGLRCAQGNMPYTVALPGQLADDAGSVPAFTAASLQARPHEGLSPHGLASRRARQRTATEIAAGRHRFPVRPYLRAAMAPSIERVATCTLQWTT